MWAKCLLLLMMALSGINLSALSFEAEELSFSLDKGSWELDGLYHFANYRAEAISQTIFFPIPQDSLCLIPTVLKLELADGDSLASCKMLHQSKGSFAFQLNMPGQHFCILRIVYRQELLGNYASYIITTANAWGKPLQFASYMLNVNPELELTKLPFPKPRQEGNSYYWEFYDFSPQTEFYLEFGEKAVSGEW
jgi:hypothetical protein